VLATRAFGLQERLQDLLGQTASSILRGWGNIGIMMCIYRVCKIEINEWINNYILKRISTRLCMYIYIYWHWGVIMYICIYIYICEYSCTQTHTHTHIYIYYICACVRIHAHVCIMYTCIHIYSAHIYLNVYSHHPPIYCQCIIYINTYTCQNSLLFTIMIISVISYVILYNYIVILYIYMINLLIKWMQCTL
jgi:hypothetical protein